MNAIANVCQIKEMIDAGVVVEMPAYKLFDFMRECEKHGVECRASITVENGIATLRSDDGLVQLATEAWVTNDH